MYEHALRAIATSADQLRRCAEYLAGFESEVRTTRRFSLTLGVDAARRLRADARREFATAASLAPPQTASQMGSFVPGGVLLPLVELARAALGVGEWKGGSTADGFRYVPTRADSRAEQEDLIAMAQRLEREGRERQRREAEPP